MNAIKQTLQKERPPRKHTVEANFMTFLHSVLEYEASIGIKPQPEAPIDLEAMYDDLPTHSIVRRITQNLVLATRSCPSDHHAAHEIMKDDGRGILALFLSSKLKPRILTPLDEEGMPEVRPVIMQAAREIEPAAPAEARFENMTEQSQTAVIIQYSKDFHQWALSKHALTSMIRPQGQSPLVRTCQYF